VDGRRLGGVVDADFVSEDATGVHGDRDRRVAVGVDGQQREDSRRDDLGAESQGVQVALDGASRRRRCRLPR